MEVMFKATYDDGISKVINLTQYAGLFESDAEMWSIAAREAVLAHQNKHGIPIGLDSLQCICC